jgi:hypothetical protein
MERRSYDALFSSIGSEIGSQLDSSFSMSCRKRINTNENSLRSVLTLRSTPTLLFFWLFLISPARESSPIELRWTVKVEKKEVGELMSILQATRECQDPFFSVFFWEASGGECCSLDRQGRGNWEVCTLEKGAFNCWSLFNTLRFRRGGSRMTWRVFPFTPEYPCKVRPEKLD